LACGANKLAAFRPKTALETAAESKTRKKTPTPKATASFRFESPREKRAKKTKLAHDKRGDVQKKKIGVICGNCPTPQLSILKYHQPTPLMKF